MDFLQDYGNPPLDKVPNEAMDLLKELAIRSEKRRTGTGKREFLALKDEIEKALQSILKGPFCG